MKLKGLQEKISNACDDYIKARIAIIEADAAHKAASDAYFTDRECFAPSSLSVALKDALGVTRNVWLDTLSASDTAKNALEEALESMISFKVKP